MSIINSQPLIGASGNQSTAYNLTRSLRFRSSASNNLSRTPSSAGDRKTWTWSAWIKRGELSSNQCLFEGSANSTSRRTACVITTANELGFYTQNASSQAEYLAITPAVFRDPSAWYHVVFRFDTTQSTAANRSRLYVNGVQQTLTISVGSLTQNTDYDINSTGIHRIASIAPAVTELFDGYMAEVHFIDGQSLDASSFGETDTATGVWKPKKYTGTYGTNGFYLKFDNLTSTSTLGNDSSGNSNTWTVNNISLTSGATYDSMKDVPTLTDADTANYAVLNPLALGRAVPPTLSEANLKATVGGSNGDAVVYGTMGVSSGKWYWEVTPTTVDSSYESMGVNDLVLQPGASSLTAANWLVYQVGGQFLNGTNPATTGSSYGNSFTSNDVIGIALDMDNGKIFFSKNGVFQNSGDPVAGTNPAASSLSGTKYPVQYFWAANSVRVTNFGQRPFAYTPPSGFKALNTFNLPTPTIGATASTQANDYFDVSLWTGNGSTQSITNSGSMQPDFVWIKGRNAAWGHRLADAVRGVGKEIFSNDTSAELTNNSGGYLTAFNSNGFSINSGAGVNTNNDTYVGWQWKANGAGSSNTAGSITSTVSANTTAGFSIVTYTGTGSTGTVGHGLGVAPKMIISKNRSAAENWRVAHTGLTNMASWHLNLDTTQAQSNSGAAIWNNTTPTSTIFGVGTDTSVSGNGNLIVAYCFAEVAGYSAFGSYTGNGSTDGTFVFTGFRPRFVMLKQYSGAGDNWHMMDTSRDTYNAAGLLLNANLSNATNDARPVIDILSNGFKLRNTYSSINGSGSSYLYACFAENPFKYSLAR